MFLPALVFRWSKNYCALRMTIVQGYLESVYRNQQLLLTHPESFFDLVSHMIIPLAAVDFQSAESSSP